MFNQKKAAAPTTAAKVSVTRNNGFLAAASKKTSVTQSANGAKKYTTTGSAIVDQLKQVSSFLKPRPFAEICTDQSVLWAEDPLNSLKFICYLRTVTRPTKLGALRFVSQHGEGLKHEAIMRMIWLAVNHKETFLKNINIYVALGSWHDIFTMLQTDLVYNGWEDRKLPWEELTKFIMGGLENPLETNLVKKYMPHVKAGSKCTTIEAQANNMLAKWLCAKLFGNKEGDITTYKRYRKMKSSGTAHEWQKLISQARFNEIEFDKIAGKALSILVKSKFLKNKGLSEKFATWVGVKVKSGESIKTTDFVHDLLSPLQGMAVPSKHISDLIVGQFQKLQEDSGEAMSEFPLMVVRDTSGSMSSKVDGLQVTSNHIAKSIALFLSTYCKGMFADSFLEFSNGCTLHKWRGSNVVEKYLNDTTCAYGTTNFQSVIDLFISLRQQGVPEEDFPRGIVCISDGEFNSASLGKTNWEAARAKLQYHFSPEFSESFKFVFWNIYNSFNIGSRKKFESHGLAPNVFYFGGFSPAVIKFITGKETAEAAALSALDQEVLNLLEL